MSKEFKEMMENMKKFDGGIKISSFETKDLLNHAELAEAIFGKDSVLPYSYFFQNLLETGKVDIDKTRSGGYKSSDFIFIENNYNQTELGEDYKSKVENATKNINKDTEKIEKLQKQYEEELKEVERLKRDYDNARQALTRGKKKKLNKTELKRLQNKSDKAKDKYNSYKKDKGFTFSTKENKMLPTKSNKTQKEIQKRINNISRNESNIEVYNDKISNDITNEVVNKRTRLQEGVEINKNGATVTRKVYDDELLEKISHLDKNDINYRGQLLKLEKENPTMVHEVKTTYKTITQTSSKKRQAKMFAVKDTVQIDGKEIDYSQSLVYDYKLDNEGKVISKTFTKEVDNFGVLQKAKEASDKYFEAIEKGESAEVIEKLRKDAEFKLVEFSSYEPLNQSAIRGGFTEPIESNNILILDDIEVDISCDAMVEDVKYVKYEKDLIKYNAKTDTYKLNGEEIKLQDLDLGQYASVEKTKAGNLKVVKKTELTRKEYNALKDTEKDLIEKVPYLRRDKNFTLKNVMHDGMALIDKTKIKLEEGCNSALLRGAQFKANANVMDVHGIIKAMCEARGKDYEKDFIIDSYGNKIFYKDVDLITTRSATKFDKVAEFMFDNCKNKTEAERKMKELWDKVMKEQYGNCFGIVKSEHGSKFGTKQKSSYQVITSLNMGDTKEEAIKNAKELLQDNINRINRLKDDKNFYEYVINNIYKDELTYSSKDTLFAEMLHDNKDFLKTKEFRQWKSSIISGLKKEVEQGRLLLEGDNMVVLGDPMPLLAEAIDGHEKVSKNIDKYTIFGGKDDDKVKVCTSRFNNGDELGITRSPHANDSSLNVGVNKKFKNLECEEFKGIKLDDYMKLSKNQMIVDTTKKPIQSQTGGSDEDSDVFFTTKDKKAVEIYKRSYCGENKAPVPANVIPNENRKYIYSAENIAELNMKIGENPLGKVANEGIIIEAQYNHCKYHIGETITIKMPEVTVTKDDILKERKIKINANKVVNCKDFKIGDKIKIDDMKFTITQERVNKMHDLIDRAKNCMDLSIDNAKRISQLDINKEARDIINDSNLLRSWDGHILKPKMMEFVQKDAGIYCVDFDDNISIFKKILDKQITPSTDRIKKNEMIDIMDLLLDCKNPNGAEKQAKEAVLNAVENANRKINAIHEIYKYVNDNDLLMERNTLIDNVEKDLLAYLNDEKVYLDKNTCKKLMRSAFSDCKDIQTLLLKTIYDKNKAGFRNSVLSGKFEELRPKLIEVMTENIESEFLYGKKVMFKLEEYIDTFCDDIDNTINSLYYRNISGMSIQEKEVFLNSKLTTDEAKTLSAKWNIAVVRVGAMTRIEAINMDIKITTNELLDVEEKLMKNLFEYEINRGYKKTVESLGKAIGKELVVKDLTKEQIENILKKKSFGRTYIESLNKNIGVLNDFTVNDLEKKLLSKEGWNMKQYLQDIWDNHKFADNRLIITETTNYYNQGVLQSYEALGIDSYIYVSVRESHTCVSCLGLDGKVFKRKDAVAGVNYPYMHAHCKCTTYPNMDLEELKNNN